MAFCCDCGSKKDECRCEERSRSRERENRDSVEALLKKLAGDFTKPVDDSKNEIMGQIKKQYAIDGSLTIVVGGASGDLAKKKIYPTLWALFRDGLMPPGTQIFGYARSKMTVGELRGRCEGTVKAKEGEEAALDSFWASNHYVAGSYDTQRDFEILNQVSDCPHCSVIMMTCYRRWRAWRRDTQTDCFTLHFLPACSSRSRQC